MKPLLKLSLTVSLLLAGGFGLLFGYATTLPSELELSTSAPLDAPPEAIFPLLVTGPGAQRWWARAGLKAATLGQPPMDVSFTGDGVGMELRFGVDGMDAERWVLLKAEPPSYVIYEVDLQVFVVERTIALEPRDGGAEVTWRDRGTIEAPLMRYLTMAVPPEQLRSQFQIALEALGEVAAEEAP